MSPSRYCFPSASVRLALRSFLLASLLVLLAPLARALTADGWASQNGGTTGGTGGAVVTATTASSFRNYVENDTTARIVQISGTLDLGTSSVSIRSNKTIIGLGTNAHLIGNLLVNQSSQNVIIKNVTLSNDAGASSGDCITIYGGTNVWVDHCTFFDGADGMLDVTAGGDFVTVSWCKFYYTRDNGHNLSNLVGASDSASATDTGKLRVTYHHNWWGTLVWERMPRVRYGKVHVYNNYFNSPGNNNYIGIAIESEVLIQNNHFEEGQRPYRIYTPAGKYHSSGNLYTNIATPTEGTDAIFTPPYAYTLASASAVKAAVTSGAGVNGDSGSGGGGGGTPATPTGLTATAGNQQVSLSWNASANAQSYDLYRSTSSGGQGTTPVFTGITATNYVNGGLTNGVTYYYKVAAVNGVEESGLSNEASATPSAGQSTPVVTITANDASAAEPSNNGQFTVTASPAPASPITVNLTRTGTATSGSDFNAISNTVVIGTSGTATINVTVINDSTVESSETVILTLAAGTGYTVGGASSATVTIADNDTALPSVQVSLPDPTAGEPGNNGKFRLYVTPATGSQLVVNIAMSGTATNGVDYVSIPATKTIPGSGSLEFILDVNNDSLVEGSEAATLTVLPGTGYSVGSNSSATITITDNDP